MMARHGGKPAKQMARNAKERRAVFWGEEPQKTRCCSLSANHDIIIIIIIMRQYVLTGSCLLFSPPHPSQHKRVVAKYTPHISNVIFPPIGCLLQTTTTTTTTSTRSPLPSKYSY